MHIRERCSRDTSSEGGRVKFVIGVKDEGDVEGALGGIGRDLSVQHQEKVCGMGERTIRIDYRLALANAVVGSDDHWDLRGEANRLMNVGVAIIALLLRIVERKSRDNGAEDVHGQRVFRSQLQTMDDGRIKFALFFQAVTEITQLVAGRKVTKPQEVAGLFKG